MTDEDESISRLWKPSGSYFPVTLTWGRVVPLERLTVSLLDEGLLYGRGLFETTRTHDHFPWLWKEHCERLLAAADDLEMKIDPKGIPSSEMVTKFVASLRSGEVAVRLNASAGSTDEPGKIWLMARSLELHDQPLSLKVSPYRIEPSDPYARWKTFHYGVRLLAHQHAIKEGFDSAILLDSNQQVLETARSNLFVRIGSNWLTPPAETGTLAGTVRAKVLQMTRIDGLPIVQEKRMFMDEFNHLDEAFVTNSVQGIQSVKRIGDYSLPVVNGDGTQLFADLLRRTL